MINPDNRQGHQLVKVTSKAVTTTAGLLAILLVLYSQLARAGWSVKVGPTGSGTVTLKVTSSCRTNIVQTPFMLNPSAAINRQSNFVFAVTRTNLACANSNTFVQVRAFANYVTSIQSKTAGGDLNDSDELLPFVIPRSACASGNVEVVPLQILSNSITLQYKAQLSDEGSAILLRVVDAVTEQQRYVVLVTGPTDNGNNNCEGIFTVFGDPEQLLLLVDGNTSTLPFDIVCPDDMVIGCSAPVLDTYDPPAVATGDTGPFMVTYDPLPSQLVFGVTNTVTATAMDTNGCTVSCQFKVYRQPIVFEGFFSPMGGADATGGSCQSPLRTFKLGNVVPVKFEMTCGGLPVNSGVPIITIQSCAGGISFQGPFHNVNDQWHFNIDSSIISVAGKYRITATLPDGSQHSAVIQYKR